MNDYTKALHQRFYQEPENTEEEREMDRAEQALKVTLDREQRKLLLALINAQSLWQERTSLESLPPDSGWGWASLGSWSPTPSTMTRRSGPDGSWKLREADAPTRPNDNFL